MKDESALERLKKVNTYWRSNSSNVRRYTIHSQKQANQGQNCRGEVEHFDRDGERGIREEKASVRRVGEIKMGCETGLSAWDLTETG